jgi:hypothetical protein
LRNAARDLWRALEVDRTVHPESHENTRQESIDALYEMAKFAGIGDDDAQGILVSCFKEQPKSNGADVYNMHTGERLNGGVDQGDTPKNGWRTHVFTAASLKEKKFEQISFVVPNLIPEGLTIFAGRPKVGNRGGRSMLRSPRRAGVLSLANFTLPRATFYTLRLKTMIAGCGAA